MNAGHEKRTKVEIEDASLAHVLDLAARLADLGCLHALATAGLPGEHCERPRADLALLEIPNQWCKMGGIHLEIRADPCRYFKNRTKRSILGSSGLMIHSQKRIRKISSFSAQTLPYFSLVMRMYGLGPRHVSHRMGKSAASHACRLYVFESRDDICVRV